MDNRKQPYNPEDVPDIPGLENRGWEAMRQMLDAHMPQKEENRRIVPVYWRWMAAAALLLLVGKVTFRLLTGESASRPSDTALVQSSNTNNTSKNTAVVTSNPHTVNTQDPQTGFQSGPMVPNNGLAPGKPAATQVHPDRDLALVDHGNKYFVRKNNHPDLAYNAVVRKGTLTRNPQSANGIPGNGPYGNNGGKAQIVANPSALSSDNVSSKDAVAVASIPDRSSTKEIETAPKTFNMDVAGLADNNKKQTLARADRGKEQNKENVEAASGFRQRMNQALWDDEKSDSAKRVALAKAGKAKSDSQLVAKRREQLAHYFGEKEEKEKAATHKAKVDVAVLVNRNMAADKGNQNGGSIYNLPVYPAVSASVRISDRIGFSAGLGTAAPGNFTNTSIGGPVAMSSPAYGAYVNATIAPASDEKVFLTTNSQNAKFVSLSANTTDQIQQAYYWQIPLLFDYYVGHTNLKLSAGTDFSIVQKVLVGNAYASQLMDGGTFNSSGNVYQVRNFDPRLSVGAQYKVNRFLIGARFSRSFQPALQYNGAPTNGGNNQVFNFSIGYSFFK